MNYDTIVFNYFPDMTRLTSVKLLNSVYNNYCSSLTISSSSHDELIPMNFGIGPGSDFVDQSRLPQMRDRIIITAHAPTNVIFVYGIKGDQAR